jgi:hypothetical protein
MLSAPKPSDSSCKLEPAPKRRGTGQPIYRFSTLTIDLFKGYNKSTQYNETR